MPSPCLRLPTRGYPLLTGSGSQKGPYPKTMATVTELLDSRRNRPASGPVWLPGAMSMWLVP